MKSNNFFYILLITLIYTTPSFIFATPPQVKDFKNCKKTKEVIYSVPNECQREEVRLCSLSGFCEDKENNTIHLFQLTCKLSKDKKECPSLNNCYMKKLSSEIFDQRDTQKTNNQKDNEAVKQKN